MRKRTLEGVLQQMEELPKRKEREQVVMEGQRGSAQEEELEAPAQQPPPSPHHEQKE